EDTLSAFTGGTCGAGTPTRTAVGSCAGEVDARPVAFALFGAFTFARSIHAETATWASPITFSAVEGMGRQVDARLPAGGEPRRARIGARAERADFVRRASLTTLPAMRGIGRRIHARFF